MRQYTTTPRWKAWYAKYYAEGRWRKSREKQKQMAKHKERILRWSRLPKTRQKLNAYHRTEKWKEYMRLYRQTPQYKANKRRYRQLEHVRKYNREYSRRYSSTPQGRITALNARHKRATVERATDITSRWLGWLKARTLLCVSCGGALGNENTSLDHILPIFQGGAHRMNNVRFLCLTCNVRRPRDGSDVPTSLVVNNTRWGCLALLPEVL